ARRRWAELGLQASIGAPIVIDGRVWGAVMASRTQPADPFPPDAEHQLGDFAALVAQAIVNADARRETAELVAEQSALRRIAAPVIIKALLLGALTALRPGKEQFPSGAAIRLRSFADLAAQSIANERAQAELRASRARIVRTADETRERFERNLHDGAQQRLVSVSIALRLATAKLPPEAEEARALLVGASDELTQALEELRDLARGLHPVILTEAGLGPALDALASRAPLPVAVENRVDVSLPAPVEAAVYYVVSESLTNVAKYAHAS